MTARHAERGQVLPLVALCLAVLMGFAGLAVDVGYWEYQQRQQQSAADAAALGAAQALVIVGCPSSGTATTAGRLDATANGYTDNSGGAATVLVTINNPPTTGPFAGQNCAVQATVTNKNVNRFFTRILGQNTIPITTQAVATLTDSNGCIYMLGPNQNTNFHGATVTAPNCSIMLNGSANFNGATVTAAGIGEVDFSGSNNGGSFLKASPAAIPPVTDPCPEIAGCAEIAAHPPQTSPCNGIYSGGSTLTQGCYNNLSLDKKTVTLTGGTYVLAGSSNFNMASVTGSGVTIYVPAGATTNFNKANSLTLTPPASGQPYAGVTYYQVPSNSNDINFNGSSTNLAGLIYAPSAAMNYNGSQGQYTILVAAYANLNNSTGEDFGAPASGQSSLLQKAVLAQ